MVKIVNPSVRISGNRDTKTRQGYIGQKNMSYPSGCVCQDSGGKGKLFFSYRYLKYIK